VALICLYVRRRLKEFANVLGNPNIIERFEAAWRKR